METSATLQDSLTHSLMAREGFCFTFYVCMILMRGLWWVSHTIYDSDTASYQANGGWVWGVYIFEFM